MSPHLPTELLLHVATFLKKENDINALAQTNQLTYLLLNPYLYRHNSLMTKSSALLWAARQGNEATSRICVSEGANLEVGDEDGRTPLYWAACHGHQAVVKMLLETGRADVDPKEFYSRTPLSTAAANGH